MPDLDTESPLEQKKGMLKEAWEACTRLDAKACLNDVPKNAIELGVMSLAGAAVNTSTPEHGSLMRAGMDESIPRQMRKYGMDGP